MTIIYFNLRIKKIRTCSAPSQVSSTIRKEQATSKNKDTPNGRGIDISVVWNEIDEDAPRNAQRNAQKYRQYSLQK